MVSFDMGFLRLHLLVVDSSFGDYVEERLIDKGFVYPILSETFDFLEEKDWL